MPQNPPPLPDFTRWPSFPFEGDMRVKHLAEPVAVEPPRSGEDASECVACNTPDDAYIWVSERWRVRGMDRPTGLPIVLILECRSHLDIGDLPNLLAAELGVMTVRLERAIRSLDGVARVHVNRWGDGSAHLHMWFLARPYGRLQLRGTFLSLWDDILPVIDEEQWLENLALVAEWLAGFGGRAIAEPPHIHWQSPSTFGNDTTSVPDTVAFTAAVDSAFVAEESEPSANGTDPGRVADFESGYSDDSLATRSDLTGVNAETRDLSSYFNRPTSMTAETDGDVHADDELEGRGEARTSSEPGDRAEAEESGEPGDLAESGKSGEPGRSGEFGSGGEPGSSSFGEDAELPGSGQLKNDAQPADGGVPGEGALSGQSEVPGGDEDLGDSGAPRNSGGPEGSAGPDAGEQFERAGNPGENDGLEGSKPANNSDSESGIEPQNDGLPEGSTDPHKNDELEDGTEYREHNDLEQDVEYQDQGDVEYREHSDLESGTEYRDAPEDDIEYREHNDLDGDIEYREDGDLEDGGELVSADREAAAEPPESSPLDDGDQSSEEMPANSDTPSTNGAATGDRAIPASQDPHAPRTVV